MEFRLATLLVLGSTGGVHCNWRVETIGAGLWDNFTGLPLPHCVISGKFETSL